MKGLNILNCSVWFGDVRARQLLDFHSTIAIAGSVPEWVFWGFDGLHPRFCILLKKNQNPPKEKKEFVARAQTLFREISERVYSVPLKSWHILAIPSVLRYYSNMNHVVKKCALLCNMFIENTDNDHQKSTKNITNVDQNRAFSAVRTLTSRMDDCAVSEIY